MPASSLNRAAAIAAGLLLAGCGPRYEIERPGSWRPTAANDYNLRAMVADPRDLNSGAGTATDRGDGAARAVTRLYNDRRRPLLNVSLSRIAPAQDSQDTPASGGGGGTGSSAGAAP